MGKCKLCGDKGLFLGLDVVGLCPICHERITVTVARNLEIVQESLRLFLKSKNIETSVSRYQLAIDKLNESFEMPFGLDAAKALMPNAEGRLRDMQDTYLHLLAIRNAWDEAILNELEKSGPLSKIQLWNALQPSFEMISANSIKFTYDPEQSLPDTLYRLEKEGKISKRLVGFHYQYSIPSDDFSQEQPNENRAFFVGELVTGSSMWEKVMTDHQFQMDNLNYNELLRDIESDYSVLNTIQGFSGPDGDKLIQKCFEALKLLVRLVPKWDMYYNHVLPRNVPAFKRLAMIYEKRGEYEAAANICVNAIKSGFPADGSKAGMRGRLARMIKKGNLETTPEMQECLTIE